MAATLVNPHERECAVCMNDFKTPKILPCGHLLCRECVVSWIFSKTDAGCPLCRCPIVESRGPAKQIDKFVDALPTDFVMEALVDSARLLAKHRICHVCDDVSAEFICMQCLDMMCSSCANIHKKMSISRSHDVESVSTVTPERLAASRPALCADHGDKHAEFFCTNHSLAVCASCSSKKHKTCSRVCLLDDIKLSNKNTLDDLMKVLVEAENQTENALIHLDACFKEVDDSERSDIRKVDEVCDRLQELVEKCRRMLKEQTCDLHSRVKSSLSDAKAAFGKRLAKVTSHKHIVSRAKAAAPCLAMIRATSVLSDRVNSLDLKLELRAEILAMPRTSEKARDDVVIQIEKQLRMLEQLKSEPEPEKQVLKFSAAYGKMTPRKLIKMPAEDKEYGLFFLESGKVVSREPLKPNIHYRISLIENVWEEFTNHLQFGVSGKDPSACNLQEKQDFSVSRWIKWTAKGSYAGLMMDSSKVLHFYFEDKEIGTQKKNVPRPCYASFYIHTRCIQGRRL
ncbi:hypothetical protein C0Q70_17825 [Pomacea canaliculata]|uniref:RING-type domain-containing protein n=1 Tax=Pomacea canaliculata TaxID=400727 RepID=A0A2T7NLH9_POMCA|nr:hypothetical protein C0Q70_17825 [Pomacea canaliculata]